MKPVQYLYKDLLAPIKDKLNAVEEEIARELTSNVEIISRMADYLARTKGKRIRPALFLLCCRLLGVKSDRDVALATVLEFLHTATLIHDDIIDTAQTRRGKATVNSIWGNELTVLLGDYLYLRAVDIALTAKSLDILDILTKITLKLIEGEMIQLGKRGKIDISEDEYLGIIQRKTAFLFSGCSRIPAVLAGAPEPVLQAATDYCFNLGIAFQIVDDILDFIGNEKIMGKPIASDLSEGTVTLPVIHALKSADQEEIKHIVRVMNGEPLSGDEKNRLLDILNKYSAIDAARQTATHYGTKATEALEIFPSSEIKEIFAALPSFILRRTF